LTELFKYSIDYPSATSGLRYFSTHDS
jgi:hypothetical protein